MFKFQSFSFGNVGGGIGGRLKPIPFHQRLLLSTLLIPLLLLVLPLIGFFLIQNMRLLRQARSAGPAPYGESSHMSASPLVIDVEATERRLPPRS